MCSGDCPQSATIRMTWKFFFLILFFVNLNFMIFRYSWSLLPTLVLAVLQLSGVYEPSPMADVGPTIPLFHRRYYYLCKLLTVKKCSIEFHQPECHAIGIWQFACGADTTCDLCRRLVSLHLIAQWEIQEKKVWGKNEAKKTKQKMNKVSLQHRKLLLKSFRFLRLRRSLAERLSECHFFL